MNTEKALIALRNRRGWLITKIATDKIGLTGGTFNGKIDDHAQKLFYVDQAIRVSRLTTRAISAPSRRPLAGRAAGPPITNP